jgi:FlaA1/EpsC-like NDP-sugar epimerase
VTHPEVTRYFMTIPEAAQLVLQAGRHGATGGDVFVLDMGEPVKIIDLARRLVALSGLQVRDADHPGRRHRDCRGGPAPGEKLYEELLIGDDPTPPPPAHHESYHHATRLKSWHRRCLTFASTTARPWSSSTAAMP